MSVDPNKYDLDELRELADEESGDTPSDADGEVFASAIFDAYDSRSDESADADDTGWLDVPTADETSGSD